MESRSVEESFSPLPLSSLVALLLSHVGTLEKLDDDLENIVPLYTNKIECVSVHLRITRGQCVGFRGIIAGN